MSPGLDPWTESLSLYFQKQTKKPKQNKNKNKQSQTHKLFFITL